MGKNEVLSCLLKIYLDLPELMLEPIVLTFSIRSYIHNDVSIHLNKFGHLPLPLDHHFGPETAENGICRQI